MINQYRALVVDDDPAIRTLVRLVLQRAGFEVVTAANGCEAIEAIATGEFDVVTLDLMMPQLDGFAVISHVGAFDENMLSRIVVLSAAFAVKVDERVFSVVLKPFDVDTLLEVVTQCIDYHTPAAAMVLPAEAASVAETWH